MDLKQLLIYLHFSHTSSDKSNHCLSTSRRLQLTGPKYQQDTLTSKNSCTRRCIFLEAGDLPLVTQFNSMQYYIFCLRNIGFGRAILQVFFTISLLRYNEINAIRMACSMGVKGCRELIQRWYGEWMENPQLNP